MLLNNSLDGTPVLDTMQKDAYLYVTWEDCAQRELEFPSKHRSGGLTEYGETGGLPMVMMGNQDLYE